MRSFILIILSYLARRNRSSRETNRNIIHPTATRMYDSKRDALADQHLCTALATSDSSSPSVVTSAVGDLSPRTPARLRATVLQKSYS